MTDYKTEDMHETERIEAEQRQKHSMLHAVLRSRGHCPKCNYVAPPDGPDRIADAIDRLTAAIDRLNSVIRPS